MSVQNLCPALCEKAGSCSPSVRQLALALYALLVLRCLSNFELVSASLNSPPMDVMSTLSGISSYRSFGSLTSRTPTHTLSRNSRSIAFSTLRVSESKVATAMKT